jgi:hypothetical protein
MAVQSDLQDQLRRIVMALIQGGPPEWIWERTPDPLKWELVPSQAPDESTVYELKVNCGLAIMRLQFFSEDEINQLRALIDNQLAERNRPSVPEAERSPQREEGVVSDPDFANVH